MADNPQDTVHELGELVVAYAKQETIGPIKGLGRYVGFGLGGALLIGLGVTFFEIGFLRVLQVETYPHLTGNWSWVPYAIVVVASLLVAAIIWLFRVRRRKK